MGLETWIEKHIRGKTQVEILAAAFNDVVKIRSLARTSGERDSTTDYWSLQIWLFFHWKKRISFVEHVYCSNFEFRFQECRFSVARGNDEYERFSGFQPWATERERHRQRRHRDGPMVVFCSHALRLIVNINIYRGTLLLSNWVKHFTSQLFGATSIIMYVNSNRKEYIWKYVLMNPINLFKDMHRISAV